MYALRKDDGIRQNMVGGKKPEAVYLKKRPKCFATPESGVQRRKSAKDLSALKSFHF